jgi:catechol 2,3-dioxygenase-like lactoylglutathione lyase family enzyme
VLAEPITSAASRQPFCLIPGKKEIMAELQSVCPVSDENIDALPVKDIADAVAFYKEMLGFSVVNCDSSGALLMRNNIRIGLVRKVDHRPEQAGSLAFEVDDLEAVHRELQTRGGKPGVFGIDEWNGKRHRTFFLREEENGYCFCFYTPVLENRG